MERPNGHAHCMSMILGSAGESIPVGDGELCLGPWQRVLFIELDRSRPRRWLVQGRRLVAALGLLDRDRRRRRCSASSSKIQKSRPVTCTATL